MLGTVVLCAVSDDNLTSKNAESRSAGIIYIFVPIFFMGSMTFVRKPFRLNDVWSNVKFGRFIDYVI